jgi:hypothetical protein
MSKKKNKNKQKTRSGKQYKIICPVCKDGDLYVYHEYMGDFSYEIRSDGKHVSKREIEDLYADTEEFHLTCNSCEFTQPYDDQESCFKDIILLANTPGYLKTPGNRRKPGELCLFDPKENMPPPQWAKLLKRGQTHEAEETTLSFTMPSV